MDTGRFHFADDRVLFRVLKQAGAGIDRAITEEELDGILDRERVFASSPSPWGDGSPALNSRLRKGKNEGRDHVVPLPREGDMYDMVDELDTSVLKAMS